MANRKRKNVVRIYFSDDEYRRFLNRVKTSNKPSISSYGLDALLNSQITPQAYIDEVNSINKNMADLQKIERGIGTNINQIAHKVNYFDSATYEDVQNLISVYNLHHAEREALWQLIKSYLARLLHIMN